MCGVGVCKREKEMKDECLKSTQSESCKETVWDRMISKVRMWVKKEKREKYDTANDEKE